MNSTRDDSERGWQNTPRVYADLDHDGTRDPGEPMDDGESDGSFALQVDTRLLPAGEHRVDVRFSLVGVHQDPDWDFAFKCLAPAHGCVRNVEINAGEETTGVDLPGRRPRPDQRHDLGRQGRRRPPRGGRGRRRAARRLPRRRPRRRARPRRAVLAQDEHHRQVHPARADALRRGRRRAAAARARAPRRRRLLRPARVRDHRPHRAAAAASRPPSTGSPAPS